MQIPFHVVNLVTVAGAGLSVQDQNVIESAAAKLNEINAVRQRVEQLLLAYDQECSAHGAVQAATGASQRELLAAVRIFAKM